MRGFDDAVPLLKFLASPSLSRLIDFTILDCEPYVSNVDHYTNVQRVL